MSMSNPEVLRIAADVLVGALKSKVVTPTNLSELRDAFSQIASDVKSLDDSLSKTRPAIADR